MLLGVSLYNGLSKEQVFYQLFSSATNSQPLTPSPQLTQNHYAASTTPIPLATLYPLPALPNSNLSPAKAIPTLLIPEQTVRNTPF